MDNKNKKYLLNRGLVRYKQADYEDAVSDFKTAIELDDKFAEAYYNRANAYSKLGIEEAACKDMKSANELGYEGANRFVTAWCK